MALPGMITGGQGGISAPSSATSGPATSGTGSVNVGGFNIPVRGLTGTQMVIAGGLAGLALLALVWMKKKK